jgi:hypothetical protein
VYLATLPLEEERVLVGTLCKDCPHCMIALINRTKMTAKKVACDVDGGVIRNVRKKDCPDWAPPQTP